MFRSSRISVSPTAAGVCSASLRVTLPKSCATNAKWWFVRFQLSDLQRTLDEVELEGDVASAVCPHCGATHLAPGFSRLMAFVCDNCGKVVKLSDDPGVDQIFGE